jgi:hypothetical protein
LAEDVRRKLVGLLDYVEQVVRLDERVAFQLSEYRLSDGSIVVITKSDTENLPGVRHDIRDDEGGQKSGWRGSTSPLFDAQSEYTIASKEKRTSHGWHYPPRLPQPCPDLSRRPINRSSPCVKRIFD